MSTESLHPTRSLHPTPGQTVGPFFHFGLMYERANEIVEPGTSGAVRLHGRVLDGAMQPLPDAMVELWHATPAGATPDARGSFTRDGAFTGWGRAATDLEGEYWFRTLEPGAAGGAPFFAAAVFARGLMDRLYTRIYLPGSAAEADPFLQSLPADRRATLIAKREVDGSLSHDIVLQGEGETVFLDFASAQGGPARA